MACLNFPDVGAHPNFVKVRDEIFPHLIGVLFLWDTLSVMLPILTAKGAVKMVHPVLGCCGGF